MYVVQVLQEGTVPDQQLLVPLAVVMSQQLEFTLYALPTKHIKEVAELHDRVNDITQQVPEVAKMMVLCCLWWCSTIAQWLGVMWWSAR